MIRYCSFLYFVMWNKNLSETECSSSEDEISVKALKEATDIDFLKPTLFSASKKTEASESNSNSNNTNDKSLRKKVQEDDNFYNFRVTATFKTYVAKKLDTLLDRIIQLDGEGNSKISTIVENKDKSNRNYGIKLLNSSTDLLLPDEGVIVESKDCVKKKRCIKEETDISKFHEAAIDPESILSKIETKAWTESHKGSVFKYKKLKNGTLIELN